MSYCRLSDHSDVYAYFDGHAYLVQVAANRTPPVPGDVADTMDPGDFLAFLEANSRPVGGRCDGTLFTEASPRDLFARMRDLATLGYRVPRRAWREMDKWHPELGLGAVMGFSRPSGSTLPHP